MKIVSKKVRRIKRFPPKTQDLEGKFTHDCTLCSENFKKGEEIYVVANFILEQSPASGDLHWRNIRNHDSIRKVEKWFHKSCFKAVAGKEFLS